jgi:predicted lactoylglutathione lyase
MTIGNFSLSLNVEDLQKSIEFYQNIGFELFFDDQEHNWVIMKNEDVVIGLFKEMIDQNVLTFNPGWDSSANPLESFKDVRLLEQEYIDKGIEIVKPTEKEEGPDSFIIEDPDGNLILIDQHV